MNTPTDETVDPLTGPPETPEEMTARFRSDVAAFAGGIGPLVAKMMELGDHRSSDAISRSIQRMMAGNVRVSGEMQVVLNLIRREKLRSARLLAQATWTGHPDHRITADVADFSITIYPATKGRWRSDLVYKTGYRPPWPRWQPTIDEAKRAAIRGLVEAQVDLDEVWAFDNLSAA